MERGSKPSAMEKTIKMLASLFKQRRLVAILALIWLGFAALANHGVDFDKLLVQAVPIVAPMTHNLRQTETNPTVRALKASEEECITARHLGFRENIVKIGTTIYVDPIITKLTGNIVNLKEKDVKQNVQKTLKRFTTIHVRNKAQIDTFVLHDHEAFCMQYALDSIKDFVHNEL